MRASIASRAVCGPSCAFYRAPCGLHRPDGARERKLLSRTHSPVVPLRQLAKVNSLLVCAMTIPSASEDSQRTGAEEEEPIVQYVVLRRDLYTDLKWPLGSVITQACHATAAALWLYRDDPITRQYCSPEHLDSMHKVVLEVKGEPQLRNLADKLQAAGVRHRLWIEQPEGFPTCLASAPGRKSELQPHFKKLKLCNF